MKADQLNENFDKADWDENESHNLHTENAVELAQAFGTPEEVEAMQRIADQHMRRGHILPHEIEERSALTKKYYNMLENETNPTVRSTPTLRSTLEGYKVMPAMDPKYVERKGLEGPFTTLSGKVVYYDPKEGKYYDPDTDIYLSYDEFQQYDNDYSGIKGEEADDFIDDIAPKETVKGPRGHLSSIVADDLNEIDCWDGYKKDGTKPGTGKNADKRVNNCVKEDAGQLADIAAMAAVAGLAYPVMAAMIKGVFTTGKGIMKLKQLADEAGVKLADTILPQQKQELEIDEGKYVSDAQRKAVHASKAEKK
jgi:hypothetical protein